MNTSVLMPLVTVIITLGGGWLVTNRIADRWDLIKKRRDMDLEAVAEFQRVYGEFFATWKIWNSVERHHTDERAWSCIERSAAIEGGAESLLVKISVEHQLSDDQVDALGALRQAFQMLREAVRVEESLGWWSSNQEQYAAFKGLVVYVSSFLGSVSGSRKHPDAVAAASNFRRITNNIHEETWVKTANRLGLTGPAPFGII